MDFLYHWLLNTANYNLHDRYIKLKEKDYLADFQANMIHVVTVTLPVEWAEASRMRSALIERVSASPSDGISSGPADLDRPRDRSSRLFIVPKKSRFRRRLRLRAKNNTYLYHEHSAWHTKT